MNVKKSRTVKSADKDDGFRPRDWVLIAAGLVVGIGLAVYALVGSAKEGTGRLAEVSSQPASVADGPSPAGAVPATAGAMPQQADSDPSTTASLLPLATIPQGEDHEHGAEVNVPRTDATELRSAMDRGEVIVIDVRDIDSYESGHIPGALHIPLAMLESQAPNLPRGKPIVAYCT